MICFEYSASHFFFPGGLNLRACKTCQAFCQLQSNHASFVSRQMHCCLQDIVCGGGHR